MSVANGIHFRSLISQLTEQEIQTFISTLNDNLVINALFYYVVHQSKTDSSIEPANDVSQTVSNIIQSRKPIETETKDIKCKSLDQLPQRLIGKVASYLQHRSYEALSQSNRATYIGCNTPNLLQSLHVDSENQAIKDKITKIPRYPFAKHVRVHVDEISTKRSSIIQNTLNKMQRVRALSIWTRATCRSQRTFEEIAKSCPFRRDVFPEQIEFLDVHICEACQPVPNCFHQYWFSPGRFVYALTHFRNIKYLSLTMRDNRIDEEEYELEDLERIESTFTDMLGLRFDAMETIGQTVLRTNHTSLRYLSIGLWRGYPNQFMLLSPLTVPELKELQFEGNDLIPMIRFVENVSSTNLEKISLKFWCGLASESTTDPESMENIIEKVIAKYLKLNVLKIVLEFEDPEEDYHYDANWAQGHQPMAASILRGIEQGLMKTQHLLRDTFKIWIKITLLNHEEKVQFMQNLKGMMRALKRCNIQDFMVILRIDGTVDAIEREKYEYVDVIPAIEMGELESLRGIIGLGANNPNGRVTCKDGEDGQWGKKQKQLRTDEACAEKNPFN